MKRYIPLFIISLFCLAACQHNDIYKEVDFTVGLSSENTYYAGEPVVFTIDGEVDNIVFYSGETGSCYEYHDRYEVSQDQVNSASLYCEIQPRYGSAGAMEIWISSTFEGLAGDDEDADVETLTTMYEGGMEGWTKLEWEEPASTTWGYFTFPLDAEYLSNLSIAFHWCPETYTSTQRTYWVNADIQVDIEGTDPVSTSIRSTDFVTVVTNPEYAETYGSAYYCPTTTQPNGTINLMNYDFQFKGCGANVVNYAFDGWFVVQPMALNKVSPDEGSVAKNMQNYMSTFDYTYEEAGTYTATFVGTNYNYMGSSTQIHELEFVILENIE